MATLCTVITDSELRSTLYRMVHSSKINATRAQSIHGHTLGFHPQTQMLRPVTKRGLHREGLVEFEKLPQSVQANDPLLEWLKQRCSAIWSCHWESVTIQRSDRIFVTMKIRYESIS